jgi:hypothetical protein
MLQNVKSEHTADQMRKEALNCVGSSGARKISRGVNGIHNDGCRNPPDVFKALARTTSYKGGV